MAKLSAKAKAANLIAAKDAHIAQLQRLNDTLRAALAAAVEDKRSMDRQFDIVSLEAGDAKKSVALFKQEALQSAVREAELRGYVQRTLEDDTVREIGPATQPQGMCEDTRQHRHKAIEHEFMSSQPPQPVRTGPSPMARPDFEPNISYWSDCAATFRNDPPSRSDPLGQRHWLNR